MHRLGPPGIVVGSVALPWVVLSLRHQASSRSQETAGWVESGAQTVWRPVSVTSQAISRHMQTVGLLPICRLSWKSRETPWSRGRRWLSWTICWPLAVRVSPQQRAWQEGC